MAKLLRTPAAVARQARTFKGPTMDNASAASIAAAFGRKPSVVPMASAAEARVPFQRIKVPALSPEMCEVSPDHNFRELFRGRYPSQWNFRKHGVTSSFLNLFLTCREQCRLHYVEALNSRTTPLAFEFGTCGHWILEQSYQPERIPVLAKLLKKKDRLAEVEKFVKELVARYALLWKKKTPNPSSSQLEQLEMVLGLAEVVLPPYFCRWDGDFTGKYTFACQAERPAAWKSLEEVFAVGYKYPDGLSVPIRGRRDGVFVDPKGRERVFDSKFRSVINHDDAMDTLPFDLQQMLYAYVTQLQGGRAPAGVLMNIARRPQNRRTDGEKLVDFLARVKKSVWNESTYDHYYVRYSMDLIPGEISSWKETVLDPVMAEVRAWWEGRAPHYMNPNALISKYGRCEMFIPITKGEFGITYRRPAVFSELAD